MDVEFESWLNEIADRYADEMGWEHAEDRDIGFDTVRLVMRLAGITARPSSGGDGS